MSALNKRNNESNYKSTYQSACRSEYRPTKTPIGDDIKKYNAADPYTEWVFYGAKIKRIYNAINGNNNRDVIMTERDVKICNNVGMFITLMCDKQN